MARRPKGLRPFAVSAAPERASVELTIFLALVFLLAGGFKLLVAQPFYIPSESMVPQLVKLDRVLVSKLAYKLHDPRRGDIIVFDEPRTEVPTEAAPKKNLLVRIVGGVAETVGLKQPSTSEYIKRVIGLPGDTVVVKYGSVFVKAKGGSEFLRVQEPYLPEAVASIAGAGTTYGAEPVLIPEGHLWVMGDNRGYSRDSRYFGPIPIDSVVGRAVYKIWPLHDISYL
ncbi:MAG TPA: signal peptidase I [Acidimicrobiales bacterium]|nr:signal peptidase I [Acidimicrobiales bacterium]